MKKLIVANWKMNPLNLSDAERLLNSVEKGIEKIKNNEVVICPPFIYLSSPAVSGTSLKLGSQNCFWEKSGAFTGEVSPLMLKNLGVKYAIIGHSERRQYFRETDEEVNKKTRAALEEKIIPIFCIGETLKEKKEGKTKSVLKKQIKSGLKKIDFKKIIIAYEPIWAIGTSNPCKAEEAGRTLSFIFNLAKTKILYGGSVNGANAKEYIKAGFDGLLVGGASLKSEEIIKIANI